MMSTSIDEASKLSTIHYEVVEKLEEIESEKSSIEYLLLQGYTLDSEDNERLKECKCKIDKLTKEKNKLERSDLFSLMLSLENYTHKILTDAISVEINIEEGHSDGYGGHIETKAKLDILYRGKSINIKQ